MCSFFLSHELLRADYLVNDILSYSTSHFVAIGKEKLPAISFLFASRGKLNKILVHHSLEKLGQKRFEVAHLYFFHIYILLLEQF
jgi:hypothetical protein